MKKCLLPIALFAATALSAQNTTATNGVEYIKCSSFSISPPMSSLAGPDAGNDFDPATARVSDDKHLRIPPALNPNAQPADGQDPAQQNINGPKPLGPPIVNWQGQSGNGYPPDPSGAAGPNHYVQAVNTKYRVYDKTGTPLMNSANLSSLWPGSGNDGDPVVLYDKYADRWFISQFQSNNSILIAISTSPDPLGTYYRYTFLPASNDFPDYPKFSIWSDGYYMTANYGTQRVVVFDRTQMLAGNTNAGMIVKTLPPNTPSDGFFAPLPADADGTLPPFGTPCYMFAYQDDAWGPPASYDGIRVFKMTTDWNTPANTTLVLDTLLQVQPFDANFTQQWTDIPQQGTSQRLDAIDGVLMFRTQYRVWAGYNSVVCSHAVIVNNSTLQSGVRWYELRQDATTLDWSVYQQSTYAPDADFRWMSSIAMDDNGSIGMAYMVSSSSMYPSLRYTGRLATDPLDQMTFTEQNAQIGTSSQSFIERCGDYSQTALDPDGLTFWHTCEYFVGGNPATRIYSFQLNTITGAADQAANALTLTATLQDNNIVINAKNITSNQEVMTDLFTMEGKKISGSMLTATNGELRASFSTQGLAKGIYLVRIGNADFQRVVKIAIP